MNAENKTSGPLSEPTSPGAPRRTSISSADYLDRQAADSYAAAANTWADMKQDMVQAGDLRLWVQRYPWPAMGVALAGGFAAAVVAARSNGATRSSPAKSAAAGEDTQKSEEGESGDTTPKKKSAASVFWSAMIDSLFDMAKLGIVQMLRSSVKGAFDNAAAPLPDSEPQTAEQQSKGI